MAEDEPKAKKSKGLKYGSLENQILTSGNEAIEIGVKAGNINVTNPSKFVFGFRSGKALF